MQIAISYALLQLAVRYVFIAKYKVTYLRALRCVA
jgi:hypothetical protein